MIEPMINVELETQREITKQKKIDLEMLKLRIQYNIGEPIQEQIPVPVYEPIQEPIEQEPVQEPVQEPIEPIQEQIYSWCNENITQRNGNTLNLSQTFELYKKSHQDANRKNVISFIKQYFTDILHTKYKTGIRNSESNQKESGYQHFDLV